MCTVMCFLLGAGEARRVLNPQMVCDPGILALLSLALQGSQVTLAFSA